MKTQANIVFRRVDRLGYSHRVVAKTPEAEAILRGHDVASGAVVGNEALKAIAGEARKSGLKIRHEIESDG